MQLPIFVLGAYDYRFELWQLALLILAILLTATEIGFRLGRRTGARISGGRAELATIQGAVLTLLALLLGFSFAMADSRFENHRRVVLAEANAIGTTFLRARLLPAPYGREAEQLLMRYVDTRIALHEASKHGRHLRTASRRSEELQAELWSRGVAAAALDPRAVTSGLFLQSLNEVIDLHSERLVALESLVPTSIMMLLLFVGVIACGLIGHGCGLDGARHFIVTLTTAVALVAVMLTVVDLESPNRGLVRVTQQSMLRLRQSLGVSPP